MSPLFSILFSAGQVDNLLYLGLSGIGETKLLDDVDDGCFGDSGSSGEVLPQ